MTQLSVLENSQVVILYRKYNIITIFINIAKSSHITISFADIQAQGAFLVGTFRKMIFRSFLSPSTLSLCEHLKHPIF